MLNYPSALKLKLPTLVHVCTHVGMLQVASLNSATPSMGSLTALALDSTPYSAYCPVLSLAVLASYPIL